MAQALTEVGVRGIAIMDVQQELGEKSARELSEQTGVDVRFYKVDVRDGHAIQQAVQDVVDHYGSLDVLISAAGIAEYVPPHVPQPFYNTLLTYLFPQLQHQSRDLRLGEVPPSPRHQHHRLLPRRPSLRPTHDLHEDGRKHDLHRLHVRQHRQLPARTILLQRLQSRRGPNDQVPRRRMGPLRYPRQRHLPRLHGHSPQPCPRSRGPEAYLDGQHTPEEARCRG